MYTRHETAVYMYTRQKTRHTQNTGYTEDIDEYQQRYRQDKGVHVDTPYDQGAHVHTPEDQGIHKTQVMQKT